MKLNEKEQTFIEETLKAILSSKARIGEKHYSVTLSHEDLNNLIYKVQRIDTDEIEGDFA